MLTWCKMLVFLVTSLFYIEPSLEYGEKDVSAVYSSVTTSGSSSASVQEHKTFTIRQSVINKNTNESVTAPTTPDGNSTSVTVDDDGMNGSQFDFDERAREDGYRITTPEESPYSVLLVIKGSKHGSLCTGSLLTAEWVLTAGHCVTMEDQKLASITIYAGGNSYEESKSPSTIPASAQLSTSSEYHAHPAYRVGKQRHDVALVRAREPFNMTATVNTVPLYTEPWTKVGYRTCQITGFGNVYYKKKSVDDNKRKTHVLSVKNPCKCNFRLKQIFGMVYPTKSYICAKPVQDYGICSGDSGGGLICDGKICATAMMIVKMYDTDSCEPEFLSPVKCASDHALTVFLDTCPYLRWINSYVKVLQDDLISDDCVYFNGQLRVARASLLSVTAALSLTSLLAHL